MVFLNANIEYKSGQDIDWRCKYCMDTTDSAITGNVVSTSTRIDEATLSGLGLTFMSKSPFTQAIFISQFLSVT